jgi:eukaryotic translation initiation factor 2C
MKSTTGPGALANLTLTSQLPPRPGHGTRGKRIAVYANYLKIAVPPNLDLTRYNFEVTPVPPGRKLRRVLQLLFELPEFSGVTTDFKSLIISRKALKIPDDYQVAIPYRAEGEDEPLQNAITYKVRVVTPTSLAVSDLVSSLSAASASPAFSRKEEVLQAMNALLAHYPQAHDGVSSVGQNRHFSTDRSQQNAHNIHDIGGGIESLRGYYQSVRPATGGLLLNVNVSHGIFLQPDRLDQLFPKLGTGNKSTLQKKVRLVRVRVTHIPPKKSKKTGEEFPRIKTIISLAQPQDGRKDDHPPQVTSFGAGPKDVKFWLGESPSPAKDESTPGKGKPKAAGPVLPKNVYISVYDYFKKSKSSQFRPQHDANLSSRVSQHSIE